MTQVTKRTLRREGFTIVELLVVVVVIGILAAVMIVSYNGITNRARESAIMSDLNTNNKKYQEQIILNGGNLTVAQFDDFRLAIGSQINISYTVRSTIVSGKVTAYCLDTTATPDVPRYFINSTDRTTPTKGVCTGTGNSGEYTLQ